MMTTTVNGNLNWLSSVTSLANSRAWMHGTEIGVAEFRDGKLTCGRIKPFRIQLLRPGSPETKRKGTG